MNNVDAPDKQAVITYPDGFPKMLEMSDSEFVGGLKFLAAVKLYELGKLWADNAARLAGVERIAFIQ